MPNRGYTSDAAEFYREPAKQQEHVAQLATTAEYNNHYFDTEWSSGGIHFVFIGKVNGNGTTSLPNSYLFIDAHPLSGSNYYRLKQVDFDGHFIYSNVVSIRISNSQVFTVFYNNQSNGIQIIFNSQQSKTQLKLFAANGNW